MLGNERWFPPLWQVLDEDVDSETVFMYPELYAPFPLLSLLLSSLELSDTQVYEPQIRDLLGTAYPTHIPLCPKLISTKYAISLPTFHLARRQNPQSHSACSFATKRLFWRRRSAWGGIMSRGSNRKMSRSAWGEREFFLDNLLVRIHIIIVMIRWTGLALHGDMRVADTRSCRRGGGRGVCGSASSPPRIFRAYSDRIQGS